MTPRQVATSLVTRFIAVGLVLMVIGSIASYYRITGFLREDLGQWVAANQLAMAGQVARTVEARLGERRLQLERLAATLPGSLPGPQSGPQPGSPSLPARPDLLRTWITTHHAVQVPFSTGLLVADPRGRILSRAPSSSTFPVGPDISADPAFRAALEGRTALGLPQRDPATRQAVLPIAAPVWDAQGRLVAVLVGITDLATLAVAGPSGAAAAPGTAAAAEILIVSPRDGLVVAASDPARVLQPLPPGLQAALAAGPGGSAGTVARDDLAGAPATAAIGDTGWHAAVRIPTAEAFAPIARTRDFLVQLTITRAVLVLVLVGLLITWLLRPLYRAANLAERMTRGELPLRPLPVQYPDEVGHLTAAFNRLLGTLSDKQSELETIAFHDALTGLPNRKLLVDRAVQALARANRQHTRVVLLFLDLDGFKVINDTQGHDAGDAALREVSRRLSGLVRQGDTLARLGGDEFVLLAPDIAPPVEAPVQVLAEKCLAAIATPIEWKGMLHTLEVSIGIAVSRPGDDPDSLLAAADKAMYAVKRRGNGGYLRADEA